MDGVKIQIKQGRAQIHFGRVGRRGVARETEIVIFAATDHASTANVEAVREQGRLIAAKRGQGTD